MTWNSSKQSSHDFFRDGSRDRRDRIVAFDLAAFQLLPVDVHALMHVRHEFVEMRAPLARDRARLEEQIHQHGLAAADLAVKIEALDRLFRLLPPEQPAERGGFAREPMGREPRLELRQHRERGFLRGIALDLTGGDKGRVVLADGTRHGLFVKSA